MDYNTTYFIFDAFQERNSNCWQFSVLSYLTGSELHYNDVRRKLSHSKCMNRFSLLTTASELFDGSLSIHKPLFLGEKNELLAK